MVEIAGNWSRVAAARGCIGAGWLRQDGFIKVGGLGSIMESFGKYWWSASIKVSFGACWSLSTGGCIGSGLYTMGLGIQPNGMNQRESSGPIGLRGTTRPLLSNHCVKVVRGFKPILTPISVTGTFLNGVSVDLEIAKRLSSGCCTIAHLPNGTGWLVKFRPQASSAGVSGWDALLVVWLRASPTAWSAKRLSSVGKNKVGYRRLHALCLELVSWSARLYAHDLLVVSLQRQFL